MKNWLLVLISFTVLTYATEEKRYIRVLLDEHAIHPQGSPDWTFTSKSGFILYNPQHLRQHTTISKNELTFKRNKNQFVLNGVPFKAENICIIPRDGFAGVNGTNYHGKFTIAHKNRRLYLVNHVELEEYVYSVLKTESWPGWPIEVNKALAIASRSYALAQLRHRKKYLYDVKNTNAHQTYRGMHETDIIRKAVVQTKGMILTHNNAPALTMFDSCCGGIIPAHIHDFDFSKVPYLARNHACTYCKKCRIYSWQKELTLDAVTKQLTHLFDKPVIVKDLKIQKKDKAGLVLEVVAKKSSGNHTISGKQFYGALKDIKSFCYDIKRSKDIMIFTGRGYGHHIGLCQWGAREMVREGMPYNRILSFYYPGTKLQKIT